MDPLVGAHERSKRRVADNKRKRAVKACDGCRRLKEKCDGGEPCRRCIRLRRQCMFRGPGPRAGRTAPGSAISPKERCQGDVRVQYMERLIRHYAGDISLDLQNLRAVAEAVDGGSSSCRRETSASLGSDEQGEEEEGYSVRPLGNNITHYSGEFSYWNFSMRIKQWIEHCVPDQEPSFKEYWRAEELQSPSETFASLSLLPPRHVAEFLVQSFFKHGESNYFYVEHGWLMDRLDLAYSRGATLTRRDVGTVCIIFMVLAIGTQYAYLDSLPGESGQGPTGPFSEDGIGVMFYQEACRLLPNIITVSSLECVQACLLIGIYTMPLDTSGLSYIYLRLAVTLAIQNGMHRKYPEDGLDPVVRETRNRVWWTAYTTERRVGIFHGRPLSIANADVDADMPVERTDIWQSSSPAHLQTALATIHLHRTLSKISEEISFFKMHGKRGTLDALNRLIELKNDLHAWWESLPARISQHNSGHECPSSSSSAPVSRSAIHLKLEYCLVRMFIGRPFIFLGAPSRSNPSVSSSPIDTAPPTQPQSQPRGTSSSKRAECRSVLVSDCVEASLTIIETCRILKNTIGLARASYTEFSACRAALLVIVTQCMQGKTGSLRQLLNDGVAMIKTMSSGGESAKSEASLIEFFERAIVRLHAAEQATASMAESDYARFKSWEMLWQHGSLNPGAGPSSLTSPPGSNENIVPNTAMPIPPPGLRATEMRWRGELGNIQMIGAPPLAASMDWSSVSGMPTMDVFSSMFGLDLDASPDSMAESSTRYGDVWTGS